MCELLAWYPHQRAYIPWHDASSTTGGIQSTAQVSLPWGQTHLNAVYASLGYAVFGWRFTACSLVAASLARVKSYLSWRSCFCFDSVEYLANITILRSDFPKGWPSLSRSSEFCAASTLELYSCTCVIFERDYVLRFAAVTGARQFEQYSLAVLLACGVCTRTVVGAYGPSQDRPRGGLVAHGLLGSNLNSPHGLRYALCVPTFCVGRHPLLRPPTLFQGDGGVSFGRGPVPMCPSPWPCPLAAKTNELG